jgi:hypothetical protein
MQCYAVGVEVTGLCEPSPEPWLAPAAGRSDRAARGFAALSQTSLASRFVSWAGLSGKAYVFSVFPPSACPAFCDAVLLAVTRDDDGRRRILAALDTGAFPEPVLARAEREFGSLAEALEFHVHLLARSSAERRMALADLETACDPTRGA